MSKKKEEPKPRKVKITFEVEESQTQCCECIFGGLCPYACSFSQLLDCTKYNLATLELKSVEPVEELGPLFGYTMESKI